MMLLAGFDNKGKQYTFAEELIKSFLLGALATSCWRLKQTVPAICSVNSTQNRMRQKLLNEALSYGKSLGKFLFSNHLEANDIFA